MEEEYRDAPIANIAIRELPNPVYDLSLPQIKIPSCGNKHDMEKPVQKKLLKLK